DLKSISISKNFAAIYSVHSSKQAVGEGRLMFRAPLFNLAWQMEPSFLHLAVLVLFSSLMLVLGLYLLAKFNSLFRRFIPNELVRKNVVVWMIAVCLILSLSPTTPEFHTAS